MIGWRSEDGGPHRRQTSPGGLHLRSGDRLEVTTRLAPVVTMAVGGDDGLHLLRHEPGERAACFVERIDPVTLEPLDRSPDLPGGPVWPGGLGLGDGGDVTVVFGNHAHLLGPDLQVRVTTELPRDAPYNSFVALPDGHVVTKDFGGSRPGRPVAAADRRPCELVVLDPGLRIVERLELPEASIARLSADGDDVYVVGDTSLFRVRWDGTRLAVDADFTARYRTMEGQGFGWDCVLAGGAAWFLDDGDGTEAFAGTLRGLGVATAPLHLVRVDLASSQVHLAEVCGRPGGLVANPPVVDTDRGVAVGYDSGNGVLCGFDVTDLSLRWRRDQDHASHLLLYEGTGELVTGDGADVVVLDVVTGTELARADTGSGIQSVLFPCPGDGRDFYVCGFLTVSHVVVASGRG